MSSAYGGFYFMRRMYSEKQIEDVVNKGIESGEIVAGSTIYLHEVTLSTSSSPSGIFGTLLFLSTNPSNTTNYEDVVEMYENGIDVSKQVVINNEIWLYYFYVENEQIICKMTYSYDIAKVEQKIATNIFAHSVKQL